MRLLAICLLTLASASGAQTPAPQYSLKEATPALGSNIRRDLSGTAVVPMNYTYHQLSDEDRKKVHAWYESIAEGDEPPYPLGGLKALIEPITQVQGRLRVRGELKLIATVGIDGVVSEVKAIGAPTAQMANVAGQVMLLTKFKPAVCSGTPCQMEFPLALLFRP